MSSDTNKSVVRRLIEAANTGDYATAESLLSADYVDHSAPPSSPCGPAAFGQTISTFRAAFPDFYWTAREPNRRVADWVHRREGMHVR